MQRESQNPEGGPGPSGIPPERAPRAATQPATGAGPTPESHPGRRRFDRGKGNQGVIREVVC